MLSAPDGTPSAAFTEQAHIFGTTQYQQRQRREQESHAYLCITTVYDVDAWSRIQAENSEIQRLELFDSLPAKRQWPIESNKQKVKLRPPVYNCDNISLKERFKGKAREDEPSVSHIFGQRMAEIGDIWGPVPFKGPA